MNELREFLSIEENKLNWKLVSILILIAYLFNIAVRYIYISYVGDVPEFQWHNHLMLNNNDGYTWAEGARDILAGFHQDNDLSRITYPASILTAGIAKFLPFIPFDVLIEYLPGFLGSLVVIPVVLIGRLLGSTWIGFLAGLMSGMVWSYYHRTMFGYYDTDMLVIVLPTFALWAILWSLKTQNKSLFFLAPLIEIVMIKWHGGLFNVANGFFIMSAIYVVIFSRNKNSILFLLFLIVPLLPTSMLLKLLVLGIIFIGSLKIDKEIKILHFLGAILGVYLIVIGIPWIIKVLNNGYFTRAVTENSDGFKYFSVVNTVSEASHINYDVLVHRISGSYLGFILGLLGYVLLSIRYPIILISLPMVVLGLFAVKGGLRFTIFAVPFFALGDAYIAYLLAKLGYKIFNEKIAKIGVYIVSFGIMSGFIYPNYKHIHQYIMPTVFNSNEVAVLDKLKSIANREDYVLTWWDYGYPIRYYSDVKTLVDGGKHYGKDNFPVSFALTRDLLSSRNMAVLDVYQTEYNYNHNIKDEDYLKFMMQKYKFTDPNDFLEYISTNIELPKIKENIYYYLPLRMMNIFPTVSVFSTMDLKTGKKTSHFFLQTKAVAQKGAFIILRNGFKIDLKRANIIIGKQVIPIHKFAVTSYDNKNNLHKKIDVVHKQGLNIVFMKSYNKWLIMDDFFFNSAYVQLFVFENTQGLFEPVITNPLVKVYKVKK